MLKSRLQVNIESAEGLTRPSPLRHHSPHSQGKLAESANCVQVLELPRKPEYKAEYSFARLPRKALTQFNHGLHKYPAKFIPQLPQWALTYADLGGKHTVLDPFCGSGTTLVESGLRGCASVGTDISPLAVVITRAKTARLESKTATKAIQEVLRTAKMISKGIVPLLKPGSECLGLHRTWSFWFRPDEMSRLIALREAIIQECGGFDSDLGVFLLACLSSIAKSCSRLNEDQIKVRFDDLKELSEPFGAFDEVATNAVVTQMELSAKYDEVGARFRVEQTSAAKTNIDGNSVDAIITSPPYINAIDYTMAHKYNLFILGLIRPQQFKAHCRDYIGVTERAVRVADIRQIPETGFESVDAIVSSLWEAQTSTAKNRAFVVAQYFRGMSESFAEMRRVLRKNCRVFFVVGENNRICGHIVPTATLLGEIAQANGLSTELLFFHRLANRSSMRLNRSATGGQVGREAIYVFAK